MERNAMTPSDLRSRHRDVHHCLNALWLLFVG
jgi:hypothetical protein